MENIETRLEKKHYKNIHSNRRLIIINNNCEKNGIQFIKMSLPNNVGENALSPSVINQ